MGYQASASIAQPGRRTIWSYARQAKDVSIGGTCRPQLARGVLVRFQDAETTAASASTPAHQLSVETARPGSQVIGGAERGDPAGAMRFQPVVVRSRQQHGVVVNGHPGQRRCDGRADSLRLDCWGAP